MTDTLLPLRDYQPLRWRRLAEKRLDYITELFETGRWSRYYREHEFLDVIKQSKALVETWRKLAPLETDPRLPLSPFAAQADEPVTLDVAGGEVTEAADRASEPDNEPTLAAAEPEIEAEPRDDEAIDALAPGDFNFEDELATVALQRLRETAAMAFSIARAS